MATTVVNSSVWRATKLPKFRAVAKAAHYDVVIVGAGITGLTAAYLLKQAGKKVCVLERDRLGIADTGNTTAHLTYVTDLRLQPLVQYFGEEPARVVWQGGVAAINTIEKIADRLDINCEFRRVPAYLHAALDGKKDERSELCKEADLARKLHFDAHYLDSVPHIAKPGIRFSNQAKFHVYKYLAGLAKAIHGQGSAIFEQSDVSEVVDEPLTVVANDRRVSCDFVVVATHVPLMGKAGLVRAGLFQSKLSPYSSYAVGAKIPKASWPEACFWDTSSPYYYLRVDSYPRYDFVIFGGADHKTGQKSSTKPNFAQIEAKLATLIPKAQVTHRWSGQVIETNDGLPYIGETAPQQFVATGFSGNGMTFGTLAATMACDAVLGRTNAWQSLFAVNRKKLRGGTWNYVKENLDFPYYLIRDRLMPSTNGSPLSLKPGDAKVIDSNGNRVACFRHKNGKLSKVSAICTHMGCVVQWNNGEQTWDCPCHGSRFSPDGKVMAGPAESPLEPIKTRVEKERPKKGRPSKKRRKERA